MTDIDDRMRDTVMDGLDDESPADTRALRAHAASMIRNAEEKLREERKVHYCLYESLHRCHEAITRFEAYGDIANHLAVGKAKNTLIMAESFSHELFQKEKADEPPHETEEKLREEGMETPKQFVRMGLNHPSMLETEEMSPGDLIESSSTNPVGDVDDVRRT